MSKQLSIKEAIHEITTLSLNRILKDLQDNVDDNHYISIKDLKELAGLAINLDKTSIEELGMSEDGQVEYAVTLGGYEEESD